MDRSYTIENNLDPDGFAGHSEALETTSEVSDKDDDTLFLFLIMAIIGIGVIWVATHRNLENIEHTIATRPTSF